MKTCKTYEVKIYIGGELSSIENCCRMFCFRGACVSVFPAKYIYTGGQEIGACIRIINYPRFPKTKRQIFEMAKELAIYLLADCFQRSCTIVTPEKSYYLENKQIIIPR